jgi:hypothetical protein
MLTDELRGQLRDVLRENPHRGADHLFVAARRAGADVTRAQLAEFLREPREDVVRLESDEMHADRVIYNGKSAAQGALASGPCHLPRPDVMGFLLVVDVFTREMWASPIANKTAAEVLRVFRATVPAPPRGLILTTDLGGEFTGAFGAWCNAQGIILRTRSPGAKNDIAVLDRAMGRIKLDLAKECTDRRTKDWVPFLDEVVGFNNSTLNKTIHGFPRDVARPPVQEFLVEQEVQTQPLAGTAQGAAALHARAPQVQTACAAHPPQL